MTKTILKISSVFLLATQLLNAQTIEFREAEGRYYDGEGPDARAKELKPIVNSLTRSSYSSVDMIVYCDEATNSSIFSKVVKKKEKDMSGGMLYYKLWKPYKLTFNTYNGLFNYKVSLNGTIVYDGPSPDSYGVENPNKTVGIDAFNNRLYIS